MLSRACKRLLELVRVNSVKKEKPVNIERLKLWANGSIQNDIQTQKVG
jgi:hypothetical protein